MKLMFRDGPWDGVSFVAEFAPDFIQFEHWIEGNASDVMEFQPRTHHAYKLEKENPEGTALYRYAPGEKGYVQAFQ